MRILKSNDLSINGLKQLTFLDEFVYFHQYGSHDYHKDIENMEFKKVNSNFVGPDLMDSTTTYKRITQYEKNENDLHYQIKRIEDKFKVKINYTKI